MSGDTSIGIKKKTKERLVKLKGAIMLTGEDITSDDKLINFLIDDYYKTRNKTNP